MHLIRLCGVLLVQTLVSIASEEGSFSLAEEHQLVKDNLVHTFPVLAKAWKVSFEVKPSSYVFGWRNILRLWYPSDSYSGVSCLSIRIESSRQCSRQCSILPTTLTYAFTSDGRQQKYFHDHDHIPQLNQWTKIEVSQQFDGNTYKILFNDGANTEDVPRPKIFEGVKVYASSPWNGAQPGKIRNLQISNLNSG